MLEVAEKNLLDNKAEVTTYFINDENMKNCPLIDFNPFSARGPIYRPPLC
jgi:hypothetical protein